jgi:hypothetical protein
VTRDDLDLVSKLYLHPDRMAIIVVGERKAIEPPLRMVEGHGANLTIVDVDGKPAALPSASGRSEP